MKFTQTLPYIITPSPQQSPRSAAPQSTPNIASFPKCAATLNADSNTRLHHQQLRCPPPSPLCLLPPPTRLPPRNTSSVNPSAPCIDIDFRSYYYSRQSFTFSPDLRETIAEVDKLMKLEQRYKNVEEEDIYEELKKGCLREWKTVQITTEIIFSGDIQAVGAAITFSELCRSEYQLQIKGEWIEFG